MIAAFIPIWQSCLVILWRLYTWLRAGFHHWSNATGCDCHRRCLSNTSLSQHSNISPCHPFIHEMCWYRSPRFCDSQNKHWTPSPSPPPIFPTARLVWWVTLWTTHCCNLRSALSQRRQWILLISSNYAPESKAHNFSIICSHAIYQRTLYTSAHLPAGIVAAAFDEFCRDCGLWGTPHNFLKYRETFLSVASIHI